MKKILFLIAIVLSLSPILADGIAPSGTGTPTDPYLIESLDNLLWLSTTDSVWDDNAYFQQTCDIDAYETRYWNDGAGFRPIGLPFYPNTHDSFHGNYNGDNNAIENLYINRPTTDEVGFFSHTTRSVKNIKLTNCNVKGNQFVGGVTGILECNVENIYVSGEVYGYTGVGGVFGAHLFNCINIESIVFVGNVIGHDHVGGIIGAQGHPANRMTNLRSSGFIHGEEYIGGIAGMCNGNIMKDMESMCTIEGSKAIGGLFGRLKANAINNCYYNYDNILVNGSPHYSFGALPNDIYQTWIQNNRQLDIDDYLSFDGQDYLINNAEDIRYMAMFGANIKSYKVCNNIDLSQEENLFIPYFNGIIKGQGMTITGLNVSNPYGYSTGFIGKASQVVILDLNIENASIEGGDYVGIMIGVSSFGWLQNIKCSGTVSGAENVGGICGFFSRTMHNCEVSGIVAGEKNVGGMIGYSFFPHIDKCQSLCDVAGEKNIGGFVGYVNQTNRFEYCCAVGNITGVDNVGGFVGQCDGWVANSYFVGDVIGDNCVGGFVGEAIHGVYDSYSSGSVSGQLNVGAFAGKAYRLRNCVWNSDEANCDVGIGSEYLGNLVGLNNQEFRDIASFEAIRWNITEDEGNIDPGIWTIDASVNDGFPYLSWQDFSTTGLDESDEDVYKLQTSLGRAYPNPFNPRTSIGFHIKQGEVGEMIIYNVRGELVTKFKDLKPGKQSIEWNGEDRNGKRVASGVYFYNLKTESVNVSGKMILLK